MAKDLIESNNPYMRRIRGFLSVIELQKEIYRLKDLLKESRMETAALAEAVKVLSGAEKLKLKDIDAGDFL